MLVYLGLLCLLAGETKRAGPTVEAHRLISHRQSVPEHLHVIHPERRYSAHLGGATVCRIQPSTHAHFQHHDVDPRVDEYPQGFEHIARKSMSGICVDRETDPHRRALQMME